MILNIGKTLPNKQAEIARIRAVCQSGEAREIKPLVVDLCLSAHDSTLFLFDLKTAKPNKGGFMEHKRTLLEWVAVSMAVSPNIQIQSGIAIPYNPYEPKPYSRWTVRGMLDTDPLHGALKVGEKFWDFLGGNGTYPQLLDIFQEVGIELRPEIDAYFVQHTR